MCYRGDAAAGIGAASKRQRDDADECSSAAAAPTDQKSAGKPALVGQQQGEYESSASGNE